MGGNTREPISGQESASEAATWHLCQRGSLKSAISQGKGNTCCVRAFSGGHPLVTDHLHREKQNGRALGNHTAPLPHCTPASSTWTYGGTAREGHTPNQR